MSSIIKYLSLIFSVIIIITLAVLYIGNGDEGIKKEEKAQKQNQPVEANEQYRMGFTFNGDRTQIIDLIKGEAELHLVYSGNTKFTAKLLKTDGSLLTMLADENGPYNRKQVIDVPETGAYLFDVRTSGEWSLSRK